MSKSSIITEAHLAPRSNRVRIATHPGEILREEFMAPYGLSANALAKALLTI